MAIKLICGSCGYVATRPMTVCPICCSTLRGETEEAGRAADAKERAGVWWLFR